MPYDSLFEKIKKNKLTNESSVDKAILEELPLSDLIKLALDLYISIEAESSPPGLLTLQDYHFLANSNMSGTCDGGCASSQCRLTRVDQLSRFATLYSDTVYIQNYFPDWHQVDIDPRDPSQQYRFRSCLSGSIKIINQIEPLIRNGIIRFIPSAIGVCKDCYHKMLASDANIKKHIKELDRLYSETTSAKLRVHSGPSVGGPHIYEIHVTCDEDLFDHGSHYAFTSKLPPILLRKVLNNPSSKQYQLSSFEILRGHINTGLLQAIATDVSCLKLFCSNSNLKYLTHRTLDISLLQAITEEDNLSIKYNDVLSSQLMFEMPVFSNIPLSSLLKIRANEYDAFISYRQTINHLLNEYITQGRDLSPMIAKQIYSDIIQPKVLALDKRISTIRRSTILKSLANVAISASSLTFGLCGNSLPSALNSALIAVGLTQALTTASSLPSVLKTPPDIKNHNLYFVWKLSKMSKVL
jgi:hypothetical protein